MARGNRSDASRERTREERERAREERARRRAGPVSEEQAGSGLLADPPGSDAEQLDAPAERPHTPAERPHTPAERPYTPAEPAPPGPEADAHEQEVEGPPEPPPMVKAPDAAPDTAPAPAPGAEAPDAPADEPPAPGVEPADIPPPPDIRADLPPAGEAAPATLIESPRPPRPSRPGRRARADRARASALPPLPPRPGERPGGRARMSGRRRALARAGALVALAGVAVVLWLIIHPLLHSKHTPVITAPASVKVLIPEGKTRLQIAQIAKADGLTGSYRAASRHSALLNPASYGAPSSTRDLEGFLFPDTFDIDRAAPVSQLVEAQLTDFRTRFGKSQIAAAHALGVTPYGLLTVASMVEREAQIARDRPLIAAVIYNRLKRGMPLGIDATIYYAYELKTGIPTYTKELTESQLHIDSPYNTRLHTGLPPTPISNPGLASIEAAAHPANVPYLYYVAGADGCGEQVFSTTEAQFEVNAAAYHAAVARNGGRPPTCRKK